MNKTILTATLALSLSSQFCLSQTPKRPTPTVKHWNTDPVTGELHPFLFQDFTGLPLAGGLVSIHWQPAELARRLSDLTWGMPLTTAVQRIKILGGREDGGLQTIPATRYYFAPGIIVNIPQKNGVLTGPLCLSRGMFHYD